jgi:hypothetical protein
MPDYLVKYIFVAKKCKSIATLDVGSDELIWLVSHYKDQRLRLFLNSLAD